MKLQILNSDGKKTGEIETEIFNGKIRKDIEREGCRGIS